MLADRAYHEFWEQTPDSYEWVMAGYYRRRDEMERRSAQQAWLTANFTRADKLEPFSHYWPSDKPKNNHAAAAGNLLAQFAALEKRGIVKRIN